ncbi:hypothetical protein BGZ81_011734 [Podila clonocystis]|nr:hypothetical protein BGZ81_011734 [Podila clonocystis]
MSVGFALHFQFWMLQGYPSLRELFLSIFSEEGRVQRVLTEEDFMVGVKTHGSAHKDPRNYIAQEVRQEVYLHGLTLHELYGIHNRFNREGLQSESQLGIPVSYEPPPLPSHGLYNKAAVDPREGCDAQIRAVEDRVAQERLLQLILNMIMEGKRAEQEKKVCENDSQRRSRMTFPEYLVVPSLRKLMILGTVSSRMRYSRSCSGEFSRIWSRLTCTSVRALRTRRECIYGNWLGAGAEDHAVAGVPEPMAGVPEPEEGLRGSM